MSMKTEHIHFINTFDKHGDPLMRPVLPNETPDGTWFVFTDRLDSGEEFGIMCTYTEVLDEPPLQMIVSVESMMETYRRDHGEHS